MELPYNGTIMSLLDTTSLQVKNQVLGIGYVFLELLTAEVLRSHGLANGTDSCQCLGYFQNLMIKTPLLKTPYP